MSARPAFEAGWIQTFSGRTFYPCDPRPEDLDIADIAGALARQCRFAGHCLRFYSVAEHCCHVCDQAPLDHKLSALMHDASEAYLVDIPRPIKPQLANYLALEDRLMKVIAARYGFAWPMPAEVEKLDRAMLTDERAQNMARTQHSDEMWGSIFAPLGVRLQFWTPEVAQFEFVARFYRYGGAL